MTPLGWAIYLAAILIQIFWYVLFRLHAVSFYVVISGVLVTYGLAHWWLPYLTPVQLGRNAEPQAS